MTVSIDPEEAESRVMHRLVDFSGREVVEIGCGDGRLTWRYADRAERVLAVDPDPEEVAIARHSLPARLHTTVEFHVADVITESLPSGEFDLAILSYSL